MRTERWKLNFGPNKLVRRIRIALFGLYKLDGFDHNKNTFEQQKTCENYIRLPHITMKFSTANIKNADYSENHVIYVGSMTGSVKSELNFPN